MMSYYKDLNEYIETLEKHNLLWRIKSPVKKETELAPLVRWQFRGLTEDKRKAFLFENVTDRTGKKYDMPVLVAALAGSTSIYAVGMCCQPQEIGQKWTQALLNPISPKIVKDGAAQEVVHSGKDLKDLGLEAFPFPIDTPGFDGILRSTASFFFTKDPETGAVNIGCYSGFIQARDRIIIGLARGQHMITHLQKAKEKGQSLPAALVVGAVPAIGYVAVAKVPYGKDELAVAGGLAGEPIEVVKCKTVDIDVPATSEIVIEGTISTEVVEATTGSFGEYSGYMAETEWDAVFTVSCITHRKKPVLMTILSEMPPSESSKLRQIASESNLYKFLKYDCGISGILAVALHESSGSRQYCVIQLKKRHPSEAWQALNATVGYAAGMGKIIIAVDEDIDPRDPDSVNWALGFRMQPHRDTRITMGKIGVLDPSTAPPGSTQKESYYPSPSGASALLIDATRKWDYAPVSLPKREYMERAREIWESEGLPELHPKVPWFGYPLGHWPDEYKEAAEYNLRGEIFKLGEKKLKQQREFNVD
jgi:4-hydroxy-3-polyprenylbenzoate decarboxylase